MTRPGTAGFSQQVSPSQAVSSPGLGSHRCARRWNQQWLFVQPCSDWCMVIFLSGTGFREGFGHVGNVFLLTKMDWFGYKNRRPLNPLVSFPRYFNGHEGRVNDPFWDRQSIICFSWNHDEKWLDLHCPRLAGLLIFLPVDLTPNW